jgi:hypothetical protein
MLLGRLGSFHDDRNLLRLADISGWGLLLFQKLVLQSFD